MEGPTNQRPYRVCEACGRLTPTNSPWCAECGVASKEALEFEIERQDEQRFAAAFFSRNVWMTWAFVAANVLVFVLMVAWAGGEWRPGTRAYMDALARFGAAVRVYIDQGEWWRFITPVFIHIGPVHLFVNMYSLWAIGPRVERLYGASRFVALYLLSGIGGGIASYFYSLSPMSSGAGASGALFGLVGVLLVFGIRYRSELPGVFRQAFGIGPILLTIGLNLYIGFSIPFIDNAAHIGGLLTGAALALVIPYARRERRAPAWWVAAATVCLVAVAGSFGLAWAAGPKGHPFYRFVSDFNDTEAAAQRGVESLGRAMRGELRGAEADEAARAAAAGAERARRAITVDAASRRVFDAWAELLARVAAEIPQAEAGGVSQMELESIAAEEARVREEAGAWVDRDGPKYGLAPAGDEGDDAGK